MEEVRAPKPQARRRRRRPKKKAAPGPEPPAVPEIPRSVASAQLPRDDVVFPCPNKFTRIIDGREILFDCGASNSVAVVRAAGRSAKCCACGARISPPERFVEPPTGNLAWTNEPPGGRHS